MTLKKLNAAIILTFILTIAYQVLGAYVTSPEGLQYPNPGHHPGEIGPGTFNDSGEANPWWKFPGGVEVNKSLSVGGGIKIGNATNPVAGTIRWTGTDFEGYNGTDWISLALGKGSGAGGDTPIPGLPSIPPGGKVVFLTETITKGRIHFNGKTGIEAADEICNYEWKKYGGDPSRKFRAWISNSTVNAKDRVGNGPWYISVPDWQGWSGGVWKLVANNLSDLTDGSIGHVISTSPKSSNVSDYVVTGTGADGVVASPGPSLPSGANTHCNDWTCDSHYNWYCGPPPLPMVWLGMSDSTGHQWTFASRRYCDIPGRLYCFEI